LSIGIVIVIALSSACSISPSPFVRRFGVYQRHVTLRAFRYQAARADPHWHLPARTHTYPLVLGLEIAGTVSKLGPGVTGVKVGERVAAFLEQGGAYAEKAVVAANMLMRLPDGIPFDVGAALTVQPLTGYHMLHTIYGIDPGETVLINAIGGGVGLFTTQLAVKAGARVIGTVGTPGKEKRALEYGAERVVVTRDEDFEQAVLAFTGGRGVDLAIDSLGATMLDRTFNVVRKLGHRRLAACAR
jgi:NADPH2:quinone reductase